MEETTYTTEQIAQNWMTWLDALASGEYGKTTGTLHRKVVDGVERHCCLGVAQICLGIDRQVDRGTDVRLIGPLGLLSDNGEFFGDDGVCITDLNDTKHGGDLDFVNMRQELIDKIEGFTHGHPEVAPLVRKILAERNT